MFINPQEIENQETSQIRIERLKNPPFDPKERMGKQLLNAINIKLGERSWYSPSDSMCFPLFNLEHYHKNPDGNNDYDRGKFRDLESFLNPFKRKYPQRPDLMFYLAVTDGVPQWGDGVPFKVLSSEQNNTLFQQTLDSFQKLLPDIQARIGNEGAYEEGEQHYMERGLEVLGALMQRALYKHGRSDSPLFGQREVSFPDDIYSRVLSHTNHNESSINLGTLWDHLRIGEVLSPIEIQENIDFDNGARHFQAFVESGEELTENVVFSLHDLILENQVLPEYRGIYRQAMKIGNFDKAVFESVPSGDVPNRIEEIISRWNSLAVSYRDTDSDEALRDFLEWHLDFEITHPFVEGNGRTGRLLLNGLQQKAGMRLFVSTPERHKQYFHYMKILNSHRYLHYKEKYESVLSEFVQFVRENSFAQNLEQVASTYTPEDVELMK